MYSYNWSQTITITDFNLSIAMNKFYQAAAVAIYTKNFPALRWLVRFISPAILLLSTTLQAQTITGTVFNDGNANGAMDATEIGYPYVTVKAFNSVGAVAATATTTDITGTYSLTGLTAGQPYRVELTLPGGFSDGPVSSTANTSVQFVTAPATSINFGIYVPLSIAVDRNPLIVAGCAPIGGSTTFISFKYLDRIIRTGTGTDGALNAHKDHLTTAQTGTPFQIATRPGTRQSYFSVIGAWGLAYFQPGPNGNDAIYATDFTGPTATNNGYTNYKVLTKLATLGISVTAVNPVSAESATNQSFGSFGVGGLTFSEDGKYLYVVNMGKRNLARIDISGVNFASLPTTAPTAANVAEIALPVTCAGGFFRPTALKLYGGKIYIAGVCDGSTSSNKADLLIKVLAMDPATNAFVEVLSYRPNFQAGTWASHNTLVNTWKAPTGADVQPLINDMTFDDTGAIILGVNTRDAYSSVALGSFLLRTSRNANGTFTMENAGVSGPFTSAARTPQPTYSGYIPGNEAPSSTTLAIGPGNKWFFEQGLISNGVFHFYTYLGGTFVLPGSSEMIAGYMDPIYATSTGARYFNWQTGTGFAGSNVTNAKQWSLTGFDAIGDPNPIEIGNRVWGDKNGDGVQGADISPAGEPGLAGVPVELRNAATNTLIASVTTNASGNYLFSGAVGTSTTSLAYNLSLVAGTTYKIIFPTQYNGFPLTAPASTFNSGSSLNDSDADATGSVLYLAKIGEQNHTLDAGFVTQTQPVDLSVTKIRTSPQQSTVGGAVSFQVVVKNNSATQATNVVVSDPLAPADFSAVTGTPSQGAYTTGTGSWSIGTLTAGASATLTVNATVIREGISYNTASLSSVTEGDINPNNDTDRACVTVPVALTGSQTYTTTVPGQYTAVEWFKDGQAFATGNILVINTSGVYTFTASNGGCASGTCCPLIIQATPCSLTAIATATACNTATNQYSINGSINLTNTTGGTATITDGLVSTTVSVPASATSVPFSLTGFVSNASSHTVTVILAGCGTASTTYSAPASCTVCNLSVTAAATCVNGGTITPTLTGGTAPFSYAWTGPTMAVTVVNKDITNPNFGIGFTMGFAIDGVQGKELTLVRGVTYSFNVNTPGHPFVITTSSVGTGANSGQIITAGVTNGNTTSGIMTFTPSAATPNLLYYMCNVHANMGWKINIIDAQPNGVLTSAMNGAYSLTVTDAKSCSATTTATVNCPCNITATATPTACNPAIGTPTANQYSVSGTISLTNTVGGIAIVSDGAVTIAVPIAASATSVAYSLTGLTSDGAIHMVMVDLAGCGTAMVNYSAPASCTAVPLKASLGDYVWLDTNKNGVQDPTETGVASVTATLCDATSGTVISTTLTDATGFYSFTGLNPGTYVVKFTAPTGTTFTTPLSGTSTAFDSNVNSVTAQKGSTAPVSLSAGENNLTIDAGLIPVLASLGDKVFSDNNANGIYDTGDTPIPGVIVTLISNGTVVQTTTTASSGTGVGCYSFTGLTPGVPYSVSFTTPAGFSATTPLSGTDKAIDSNPVGGITAPVTLTAGENNITIDAGYVPLKAGLGDFVWYDTNGNGQQDVGETGVAGVTVKLFDPTSSTTTPIASLTTDANGKYLFTNLNPGVYCVVFDKTTLPTGYTLTTANSGTDATDSDASPVTGKTATYTLAAGQQELTVDAGIVPLKASLGDYVWLDTNKNGVQDPTETGVASVTATLCDATSGTVISTTLTDATGFYSFTGLNPGTYVVKFTAPTGTTFTTPLSGTSTAFDSNVSSVTAQKGSTAPVSLSAGENNLTIDAGLIPVLGSIGNYVWKDLNKNGQQDSGEPGADGVTVRLLQQTSPGTFTLVSTTVTVGGGRYLFSNLPAGTYVVEIDKATLPPACTLSPNVNVGNPGTDSDTNPTTGRSGLILVDPTDPAKQNILTIGTGLESPCQSVCIPFTVKRVR